MIGTDKYSVALGFLILAGLVISLIGAVIFTAFWLVFWFIRKKRQSRIALCLAWLPAITFLIIIGNSFLTGFMEGQKMKRQSELADQLSRDAIRRDELIGSQYLPWKKTQALLSDKVRDQLSEKQVRDLWNRWKDSSYGLNFEALIGPRNTPPDVLREYYDLVMDRARRRAEGKDDPGELKYHGELLRHPNLPPDLIEEIEGFKIERLDYLLSLNPNRET